MTSWKKKVNQSAAVGKDKGAGAGEEAGCKWEVRALAAATVVADAIDPLLPLLLLLVWNSLDEEWGGVTKSEMVGASKARPRGAEPPVWPTLLSPLLLRCSASAWVRDCPPVQSRMTWAMASRSDLR